MTVAKKVVPAFVVMAMLGISQAALGNAVPQIQNNLELVNFGEKIVTQATSTEPVHDDRVVSLYSVEQGTNAANRSCTANNLGDGFWLTARHCDPIKGDFVQNDDGEKATVTEVFLKSSIDDLAIIKVDGDISSEHFDLPPGTPEVGNQLTFIGYGGEHTYASTALVDVVNFIESYPESVGIPYKDLVVVKSVGPSRMCEGDSGGAAFEENIIYAIHTASGTNRNCEDGVGALSWLTLLTQERAEWIKGIVGSRPSSLEDMLTSSSSESFNLFSSH